MPLTDSMVRRIEKRGALETAHRALGNFSLSISTAELNK
jgi:hypothetical protein